MEKAINNDWIPHPKQITALKSTAAETLYGGARGGGKTDCGLAWVLFDIDNPLLRVLVIRKNFIDLKDWFDRAKEFYKRIPGTKYRGGEIEFASGAKIILGHLKDDNAYTKYQGHEYQRILIEELTHIPSELLYLKLLASCRSTVSGLPARLFATTNPGEAGNDWVKERFITPAEPGEVFEDTVSGRKRVFIQSTVDDNPTLMEIDPDYVKYLDSLPTDLRKQWREGSWETFDIAGAFYTVGINEMIKAGRYCRVEWDPNLPTHTYWDLGLDDETAIWFVQYYGDEIRVIDYLSGSNMGLKHWLAEIDQKPYRSYWGEFWFPFDIKQREYVSAISRFETVKAYGLTMGFEPKVARKVRSIADRINATRGIFQRILMDKEKCASGLNGLKNYRKEFDEKLQTYKGTPVHDFASHASDSFGLMAMNIRTPLNSNNSVLQKQREILNSRIYAI